MRNEFVRYHKYFLVIFTLNLFWKTTVQSCAKEKKKAKGKGLSFLETMLSSLAVVKKLSLIVF